MPQNVEIKARVRDHKALLYRAELTADRGPVTLVQTDTFFEVPTGRLKLREFPGGPGELIAYDRPDAAGPKTSTYAISNTDNSPGLLKVLKAALPVIGVVSKTRQLFIAGRTRIHIDDVKGLGWFMELEVVMGPDEDPAVGEAEAAALMDQLHVQAEDLVTGAYLDLLSQ